MPDTLLAVDSNFLMDLAEPRDAAQRRAHSRRGGGSRMPLLISSDSDVRDADRERLAAVLRLCSVEEVVVWTPREITRRFVGR